MGEIGTSNVHKIYKPEKTRNFSAWVKEACREKLCNTGHKL
ncbi:DUF3950 domain-containing protein [Salmonella enterica]|nr:DUF3950 domain-containing protein [Salmonella enterica]